VCILQWVKFLAMMSREIGACLNSPIACIPNTLRN
jgi:hypothetical protein